jgi:hypothetical protein
MAVTMARDTSSTEMTEIRDEPQSLDQLKKLGTSAKVPAQFASFDVRTEALARVQPATVSTNIEDRKLKKLHSDLVEPRSLA